LSATVSVQKERASISTRLQDGLRHEGSRFVWSLWLGPVSRIRQGTATICCRTVVYHCF